MRRIPRLRRPSGLKSSTNNNTSRPTIGPSNIALSPQRPAPFSSSSSSSTTPAFTSWTTPSTFSPSLNHFYSSSSGGQQKTPTTYAQEDRTQQDQAQEPGTELQPTALVADEIIDAKTENSPSWVDIPVGPYIVPPERAEAARAEEVADATYTPASHATGLKTVGGLVDWWERRENWAAGGDFAGFRPREKVVEPQLIEAAVRRAVIEALALREVGRDDDLVGVWPTSGSKADLHRLLAWDVKSGTDGVVVISGDTASLAERLRWNDEEDGAIDYVAFSEALTAEEVATLSQAWNPDWKAISLADPRIRFAVTKRVFQLTGQLVADHQLQSITTVQTLLHVLKKPPKPATLTQELQTRHPDLLNLPNVTVAPKRVTRGDKEIALGRFKLTQDEFKKRNLPVYGHGYVRKGKEVSRLNGGM